MSLRACRACARHIRDEEAACPFCRASHDAAPRRVGMGAAIATSSLLAACVFMPVAMPVYGAPAPPLTSPGPSIAPSASPSTEPIPPYGAAVPPSASPAGPR